MTVSGADLPCLLRVQALYLEPDLLLLDEPETHLSMDAVLWLEEFLASLEGITVVIISHNRAFLDAVVEEVVYFHMMNKNLEYWPGNYTAFKEARDAWVRKREHLFEWQEQQREGLKQSIENIRAQVARAGSNRMNAGQIRSKKIALEKRVGAYRHENGKRWKYGFHGERWRNAVVLERPEPRVSFTFACAERTGGTGTLLGLEDVSFRYDSSPADTSYLLNHVTMTIEPDDRIALLGGNGQGKSTLLKLLKGELPPSVGRRFVRGAIKIAHFSQYHVDMLDLTQTALDFFIENHRRSDGARPSEEQVREHLGSYGIGREEPLRPMSTLSGGQRSRVAFASVMWDPPHIFLVDEGSHHLDVTTLDALGDGLRRFRGAIVLVSHDEYLIREVCDPADKRTKLLVVDSGIVRRVDSLDAYLAELRPRIGMARGAIA